MHVNIKANESRKVKFPINPVPPAKIDHSFPIKRRHNLIIILQPHNPIYP